MKVCGYIICVTGPFLFNGCVKLLDIGRTWKHPKHAQWVTCPVSMLARTALVLSSITGQYNYVFVTL